MTAYYNEFDPKAAAWLRELIRRGLIADGVVDERSILEVKPEDLRGFTQSHFFAGVGGWSYALRLTGWPDNRPVWTGSPPCQPFSSAGQQKGQDDERHLAPHFAALVAECRPSVLFGEQVASSAVFGKATSSTRKATAGDAAPEWAWLDDLFERLEAAHYACGASDIPAAGVGAAHIRQRTFFGATRMDDPAGPRHNGTFYGPEGLARNETWLRLSGAGSGPDGLARATSGRQRPRFADDGRSGRDEGSDRAASDADGLADGIYAGPQGRLRGWEDTQRPDQHGHAGRDDAASGLGNTSGPTGERDAGGVSGSEAQEHGTRVTVNGSLPVGLEHAGASVGGLADAEHAERGPICQHGENGRNGANSGGGETHGVAGTCGEVCERPNAPDSPRGTADWLFCRDGKWRPVEPSTFPLANGVSTRVGRLRGYGNAIVPQAAAEFVKAFDAANNECFRLTETIDEGVFG